MDRGLSASLFAQVLGLAFAQLPPVLRALRQNVHRLAAQGRRWRQRSSACK
ncbi:hypothetical protein [Xanthomonas albilineans]|uniref:hypothetical protein n=1 Tax=Xanthomonas albilineans TaxID=29447 RepID=UPI0020123AFF|nr:hypothetical protein [Xanthomonas albilineans]